MAYSYSQPIHPFFFYKDIPPTEIYTLSLHDALPISVGAAFVNLYPAPNIPSAACGAANYVAEGNRSEEHTSELQSLRHLVCRLLLEKKNNMPDGQRDRPAARGLEDHGFSALSAARST